MKLNLNELNTIANNIRSVDSAARATEFADVREYGIKRHNETIAILREIYEFVEKNIDLFEPKGVMWGSTRPSGYYKDYHIGNASNLNCVIRDIHDEDHKRYRTYWVDDGIIFHYNPITKRVSFLSYTHSCVKREYGNNSNDFGPSCGVVLPNGVDIWCSEDAPNWDENLWTDDKVIPLSEFTVAEFKKRIDENYAEAEKVLERFVWTIKRINESVTERLKKLNAVKDSSCGQKVTKYVIEMTKVEG